MKRILFSGDSITRGVLGCSYFNLLKNALPDYELVNLGQDGDTLSGIKKRTIGHLENNNYDLVVIAAGHNDIILPDFSKKTVIHESIVKNLAEKGSVAAADFEDFFSTYDNFIKYIQQSCSGSIILTTMSCLNEDLSSATSVQRNIYNDGIRKLAGENNLILADVGASFDDILKNEICRDYFMDNLFESMLFDGRKSRTLAGADRLSKKRSLHLTIDGIHLNPAGARIYSEILSPAIEKSLKGSA